MGAESGEGISRRQLLIGLGGLGVGAAAAVVATRRAGTPATSDAEAVSASPSEPPAATPSSSEAVSASPSEPSEVVSASQSESATEPPSPVPSETATREVLAVAMLCRDAWGAVAPHPADASHVPVRLTLHHTAVVLGDNRKAPARLRQHQRYHQDNGFSDIAYHVGVDRNGHVYELRDPAVPGETFTNYDPSGHFLVLAEGDFGREQPSDAQLEGLARVLAGASAGFGIPVDTLTGHRDHDPTTPCPGDAMYQRLGDLRARATELGTGRDVELIRWCDEAAFERVAAIEAGRA